MDSLIQVSRTLGNQRDFDQALTVAAFAEKLARNRLGPETKAYGSICFNNGFLLFLQANYPESEKWYLMSKAIREKVLGKEHLDYAFLLHNMGVLYMFMGNYEKAEQLYLECRATRDRVLGKAHPDYLKTTLNLAILYSSRNNYEKATPLFLEAKGTVERTLGKINALYAAGSGNKALYHLIWEPVKQYLSGVTTIYCSPSGLLHRINLSALAPDDGQIFGNRYQLVLLGSTRQLVVPNALTKNTANTAYLAGGIRYDSDSTAVAYANRGSSSRSFDLSEALIFQPDSSARGGILNYLAATATEVHEIGQMLAVAQISAQIDTGFYATEEAFRHLGVGAPSPRIIHLATHGYFFPDPKNKGQNTSSAFGQEPVFKMSDHPMIRSGLILAGAKQAWLTGKHPQNQEDGVLTAYEISQMNLSSTELVVLSACETGLGDIAGNEGVYGLQRAFKIAGAKYLIMSLWKVDDRSTKDFMTAFYTQWRTKNLPIPQAFRAAQQQMRVLHPSAYDWAGFILIE